MRYARIFTPLAVIVLTAPARAPGAEPLALADGDRVVFLGNTFVERDQTHGYIETLLTARFPNKNVTFRNLGWSGDTVFGEARAAFDPVPEGFKRLREHVLALKPTLLIIGYGMNESFAGEAGLERFIKGLNTLLDAVKPTGAKIILIGPIRHENMGRPLPDPASHNSALKLYNDAIAGVANDRGYQFIDLFDALPARPHALPGERLTDNGIHLTSYGYWHAAQAVAKALKLEPVVWKATLDHSGKVELERGTKLSKIEPRGDGLRFEAQDAMLPGLPIAHDAPDHGVASWGPMPVLKVTGLKPGRYELLIDGTLAGVAEAETWAAGLPVLHAPQYEQAEKLRQATIKKNLLYFYRWRPQNETYLFGFRKHEQGQNAREIPLFDPLVAAEEKTIGELRVPVTHVYELTRQSEVGR